MREVEIVDETRGTMIGDRIAVAETSLARMVGLLGQDTLAAGGGLWIRPSSGVHTFGMRFPIDVIGLDADLKVLRLWERLSPNRMTSVNLRLRSVIELPPGRIAECGVALGDTLRIGESGCPAEISFAGTFSRSVPPAFALSPAKPSAEASAPP